MSNRLRSVVDAKGLRMGDTPEGNLWCLKALHPSDPMAISRGVPDHNNLITLQMNYQGLARIAAPGANPWACSVSCLPHPVHFASYEAVDSVTNATADGTVLNAQLGGTVNSQQLHYALINQAKRWRITYAGFTLHLDAPALSDQGMVTAAQYVLPAYKRNAAQSLSSNQSHFRDCSSYATQWFNTGDAFLPSQASWSALQAMPNAYTGQAKEGVYLPLRMSSKFKWFGPESITKFVRQWVSGTNDGYSPVGASVSETSGATFMQLTTTQAAVTNVWPFYGVECLDYQNAGLGLKGGDVAQMLQSEIGNVSFINLSPNAALNLTFRVGLEFQVTPDSILAPQASMAPTFDDRAMLTYYLISRELKDAYPADFNDWGKLKNAIMSAYNAVKRVIAPAWPIIRSGAAVAPMGRIATDLIEMADSAITGDAKPPAAAVQRAQQAALAPQQVSLAAVEKKRRKRKQRKAAKRQKQSRPQIHL